MFSTSSSSLNNVFRKDSPMQEKSILKLNSKCQTKSRIPAISDNTAQPNLGGNEHLGSLLIQNEQENHCQISHT